MKTLKKLIIAEKPSVARDITTALGGFTAKGGRTPAYWESDQWLCTYAIGHLLELLDPDAINPLYRRWNLDDLPIVPEKFQWRIKSGQESRIKCIAELLARPDVVGVVNACDAAREGELIFREIIEFLVDQKNLTGKQTFQRLWLQSMTPASIRQAFTNLRPASDYVGLGDAAHCRARADWLIGMNATRAMSLRLSSKHDRSTGGGAPLAWSVGRVQTPTLALLVERELAILEHEPQPYWRVVADFQAPTEPHQFKPYVGNWFDHNLKNKPDDRLFDRTKAEAIVAATIGQHGTASETRKARSQRAPFLFDLTALQRSMAQKSGWSAKRTLDAAQRCYETHKVITYPRTNANVLPSDYRSKIRALFADFCGIDSYAEPAKLLVTKGWQNEKRNFDDGKIKDHFAIIPTGEFRSLSGDDAALFDAVCRRTMAAFLPDAIYDRVERITEVGNHRFRTGPDEALAAPGWLIAYGKKSPTALTASTNKSESGLETPLPSNGGQPVRVLATAAKLEEDLTKPPSRIGEAGLLSLMENAGRQVEDADLAAVLMKAEGLGTAATRADIIENLKHKAYITQDLIPTAKAIILIDALRRMGATRLTSAELTARIERDLNEVEAGSFPAADFMSRMEGYITEVVDQATDADFQRLYPDEHAIGLCPICRQGSVYERLRSWRCAAGPACGFAIPKDFHGRFMNRKICVQLIKDGHTSLIEGFEFALESATKAKKTQRFKAVVAIGRDGLLLLPEKGTTLPAAAAKAEGASAHSQPLGPCPVHGGANQAGLALADQPTCQVLKVAGGYCCESRLRQLKNGASEPRGFYLPKTLCRRAMAEAEVSSLLAKGHTSELNGFVSKAGKPFKARLKLEKDGSWTFAFASDRLSKAVPVTGRPSDSRQ